MARAAKTRVTELQDSLHLHQTALAESNCKATRWKIPSQNRPGKTACSQENIELNPSLGSSSASYSFMLSLQRKDYACLCSYPVEYQKRKIDHAKRFLVWRIKNKFSWRLQLLSTSTALLSSPKFLGTEREILSSELVVLQRASRHNAAGLMLLHINKPEGQLYVGHYGPRAADSVRISDIPPFGLQMENWRP